MRGLIEKDLRLTLIRKQTLIIFTIVALVMGASMEGTFVVGYMTMLAVIIAVGTISYDEFDNGFAFLMTLPFERRTYVKEKYIFSLILAVIFWIIGVVLYIAGMMIRYKGVDIMADAIVLVSLLPIMYLSAAVMIPLHLKYGAEKARIVLFIIAGIIAVAVFAPFSDLLTDAAYTLDNMAPGVVFIAICALCVLASYASYVWSVRIMNKKEF